MVSNFSSNTVSRGNINVTTSTVSSNGVDYTEVLVERNDRFLPRKCTSYEPNGDKSILHEYADGRLVYKTKVNGKWRVEPYDFADLSSSKKSLDIQNRVLVETQDSCMNVLKSSVKSGIKKCSKVLRKFIK